MLVAIASLREVMAQQHARRQRADAILRDKVAAPHRLTGRQRMTLMELRKGGRDGVWIQMFAAALLKCVKTSRIALKSQF